MRRILDAWKLQASTWLPLPITRRPNSTCTEGVISGPLSQMGPTLTVGLTGPAQAEAQMEPNVMDITPTILLAGPTIPIGVTSPNANFVTNWATLPRLVLNLTLKMSPSIVLQPLQERTKIGYLIRLLPIISRVISPIYLFIPSMMILTK